MKYALIGSVVLNIVLIGFIFFKQQSHYNETLSLEKEKLQLNSQIDSLNLVIKNRYTEEVGETMTVKEVKDWLLSDKVGFDTVDKIEPSTDGATSYKVIVTAGGYKFSNEIIKQNGEITNKGEYVSE